MSSFISLIQKAYGGFPFLKDMPLQPSASAKGVYFFDIHNGLLKEAEFNAEEIKVYRSNAVRIISRFCRYPQYLL